MSQSSKSKSVEERVDHLLAQMSLEEKIGQMHQASIGFNFDPAMIRKGLVGSCIFASSALAGKDQTPTAQAEYANAQQHTAVEESRLGIPLILGRDVIHGHRTVFPIPLGQAASWDPALVEQAAAIAAREATADGVKWFFTPMLDIARDPRWGRIAEGFGEDPYLGSQMAAAAVRGYQGDDYSRPDKAAACAKHYVGYGGAEGGRDYDRVDFSLRTLRDVYMPPFHAAVDAGVSTIMSGFHDYQGVPVAANHLLLTEILREEWGFKGFVVSDWNAVQELLQHGIAADEPEAGALAVNAGVDMDMVSGVYLRHMAHQVQQGKVDIGVVDEATRRILRVKYMAGLFDHPYTDPERAKQVMLAPDHRAVARRLAHESIVLLKNDAGMLPLGGKFKRILVAGPLAHGQSELFGSWTLDGRGEDAVSIADAIRSAAPRGVEVILPSGGMDEALYRARKVDLVVLVVGEEPIRSGEASSTSTLDLPAGQRQMVETFHDLGVPLALVVVAGRPLSITREVDLAQAVLYAWQPGVEGGPAVADLLFGQAEPSGKLPISVPRSVGQVPIYYGRKNSGRPPSDQPHVVGYIDLPFTPLYPFGFGLSYTSFGYAGMQVLRKGESGGVEISAEVTNQGQTGGSEVVQLYVRDLVGSVTRPIKELKGFERVTLKPGGTHRVRFLLTPQDLAFTGFDGKTVTEPGKFHVWVGPDSSRGLHGEFEF